MDRDTTMDMDMDKDQEITTNDGATTTTTTTTTTINHHGIYSKFGMWWCNGSISYSLLSGSASASASVAVAVAAASALLTNNDILYPIYGGTTTWQRDPQCH